MDIKKSRVMDEFLPAVFGGLKRAAAQKSASGAEIIDLSIGSPDIPPAEVVRKALSEASLKENMYGYTLGGLNRFNEAVADYYRRRSDVTLDPHTEILQTMGSQEGIVHLPLAFCNEGDIILTTNPAYVAYETGIKLAGAVPYEMPLKAENDFLPDLDSVPPEIADKAKLLILNLPGNPVPANPTKSFFDKVVAFAKKHQIIVVHDAAYSEFYFEGDNPLSFLAMDGAKEVGIEINSLSKSFSLAGARIAYLAGNQEVINIMKAFKSNLDYGIFAPVQEAGAVALDHAEKITDRLRAIFKERHHTLTNGLKSLGWEVAPSSGGMFVWAKYPSEKGDMAFVYEMIDKTGIVMVPGSVFGTEGKGYVRIALVQNVETIKRAIQKLQSIF